MSLTFVDLFCGAGGSSTGLVEAGMELKLAANHSEIAVSTHAANHPTAEHLCADVSQYDMRRLPKADVLWASPICTEISPAGGRRRARRPVGQTALTQDLDEACSGETWERTRATAYDVLRAAEVHRYAAIICENVIEFATDWPLYGWWRTGFDHIGYDSQVVSVSSAHISGNTYEAAAQWRCRKFTLFTRKGIRQPDVTPRPAAWCQRCDTETKAVQAWRNGNTIGKYKQQYDYKCPSCRTIVEPYVKPAADIIDWDNPGTRIGDRKKTATKPEGLAPATMARIRDGLATHATTAAPYIVNLRRNGRAQPITRPLATIAASGNHHGLVIPSRNGSAKSTRGSAGLLTTSPASNIDAAQCRFRMLQPHEQLRAQAFPRGYIVHGTRTEQTAQAGNAVSVNVARWLGERITEVLSSH